MYFVLGLEGQGQMEGPRRYISWSLLGQCQGPGLWPETWNGLTWACLLAYGPGSLLAEGLEPADIFHWGQTWAGLGTGQDRKALGTRGHCPLAALELKSHKYMKSQEFPSSCS